MSTLKQGMRFSLHRGHVPYALGLASVALAATCSRASAADPAITTELQQVTVTARYVKENLQQTPISITALTGSQLEQRGTSSIADVAQYTPNVTIMTGGQTNGDSAEVFIRGVGQTSFDPAFDPAVGFYLDGVYYGTVFGSMFQLDDIDSVQVLRGPQGTLFGASNEGGAVLISTVTPRGGNGGYIDLGYGNYGQERIRGAFDMTLVPDKLFMRVSAGTEQSDGWFKRYDYACLHPSSGGKLPALTAAPNCELGTEGGKKINVARAALRYVSDGGLEIILRANILDDRSEAPPTKLLAVNAAPGTGLNDYDNNVAIPMFGVPLDSRFITSSPYTSYATYQEPSTGRTVPPSSTNYQSGLSATVNWVAPGGIHVKDIVAFVHDQGSFAIDGGEAPVPTFVITQQPFHRQYTEELDLSGTLFGNKLDWTLGSFYYNALSVFGGVQLLPGIEIVPPLGPSSPFAPNGIYGLDFLIDDPVHDTSISGFAHGVLHITSKLSLEAGIRYSESSKEYTFVRTALSTNPPDPIFPPGKPVNGLYGISATSPTDRVDPKLALQYQWTPQLMTYIQAATGYKGGGVSAQPVFASDVKPFGPETLISVELGMKGQWLDNRLRVDGDVFHEIYKDLQQSFYSADGSLQTVNTGKMYIDGAELGLNAIPVRGMLLDLGVGYLHFHTASLGLAAEAAPAFAPTLSTQPPYVPKLKGNLGLQYTLDMGAGGSITPRIDWSYQTQIYFDVANSPATRQPGYGLANARVSYDTADGNWEAALEAKNLLNKAYYVNEQNFLPSYGTLDAAPGAPRMILLTVRRTF